MASIINAKAKAKEPSEKLRFKANYHRPVNGKWVADFQGVVRGVRYEKGNEDGTDMHAIIFNGLGGNDLMNAPVPFGLPYARQGNTLYLKTSVVNNGGTTKGRFPFALEFNTVSDADNFELWLKGITKTKNCFVTCPSPNTMVFLKAANAQVDTSLRSPPSAKLLALAINSPLPKEEEDKIGNAPSPALIEAYKRSDPMNEDNAQPEWEKEEKESADIESPKYNVYKGSPIMSQKWF